MISEKIPLRREGNSYYVSVIVNGDHAVEMVVDTGASSVVLPYKTAMECGVKIDASAMPVQMIVASGAKFKSKMVTLDSVRVGKFSAEKVECVVLPAGSDQRSGPARHDVPRPVQFFDQRDGTRPSRRSTPSARATVRSRKKATPARPRRRSARPIGFRFASRVMARLAVSAGFRAKWSCGRFCRSLISRTLHSRLSDPDSLLAIRGVSMRTLPHGADPLPFCAGACRLSPQPAGDDRR